MGKSRRFHKRVQKRHTRKHKTTRNKRVTKIYSRKQRGGNPMVLSVAGLLALLAIGGTALYSSANYTHPNKRNKLT